MEVLFTFGSLTEELGNSEEALGYYERALEADPTHAPALVAKGSILRDRGDVNEAIRLFDAAIASEPRFAVAYDNAKGYLLQKQGSVRTSAQML